MSEQVSLMQLFKLRLSNGGGPFSLPIRYYITVDTRIIIAITSVVYESLARANLQVGSGWLGEPHIRTREPAVFTIYVLYRLTITH